MRSYKEVKGGHVDGSPQNRWNQKVKEITPLCRNIDEGET